MMDPILYKIGDFQIHWYSAILFVAFLLAYGFIMNESRRLQINTNFIGNLIFWVIIFSLIGARLYYVAFNWDLYSSNPMDILKVWEGGLAIHGGIILGGLFLIGYCKKYKVRITRITDIFVVGLAAGQVIGRWGNFFNSEAYGPETTRSFLENLHIPDYVIDGMNINGAYYQPTFLYESLWMLAGLIILLILRRIKYTKIGQLTGFYMMWYGFGRLWIEMLRQDSLMLGDFKVAQIVSIVLFVVGLFIMALASRGSRFENLYGDRDEKEINF